MQTREEIEAIELAQHEKKQPYVNVSSLPPTPTNHDQSFFQPPENQNDFTERAHRWWLWELTAWILAVLSLIGIVILLRTCDGKPVPDWTIRTHAFGKKTEAKITINAIISIFSTVLKSTIMIPIAASMSQLKWLWFHDGNKLSDIQLFDAANRGPLGSVLLIWQMRGRQVVCLGAIVVITMLGIDFSFQSVVTYPPRPITISTATSPVSHTYTSSAYGPPSGGIPQPEPVPLLKSAMRAVINDIDTSFSISPNCVTGNCTWSEQYASLGVCSDCRDATDILKKTCGTYLPFEQPAYQYCNYSWPGTEVLIPYFDTHLNMIPGIEWTSEFSTTVDGTPIPYTTLFTSATRTEGFNYFFKNWKDPLAIISIMRPKWIDTNLTTVHATQCALKMCVKKYEAKMQNNIFSEKLIATFEDPQASLSTGNYEDGSYKPINYTIMPPAAFLKDTDPTAPKVFMTTSEVIAGIFKVIDRNLFGSITTYPVSKEVGHTDPIDNLLTLDHAGTAQMMASLAGNMTHAIRMSNSNKTSAANPNAIGETKQNLPFVNVRWTWLALPVFELAITLLFLLLTMKASAKHNSMLWKGSGLAPFYHPLTADGRSKVVTALSPKQMDDIASDLKVQWAHTDKGLRLIQPER